jgi:hypothetical protein
MNGPELLLKQYHRRRNLNGWDGALRRPVIAAR